MLHEEQANMRRFLFAAGLLSMLFGCLCAEAQDYELEIPVGLKNMRIPKDNPLTKAKIELGKQF